eukprot:scaffold280012_cov24-Tisochrysis_lutea.AAC.1
MLPPAPSDRGALLRALALPSSPTLLCRPPAAPALAPLPASALLLPLPLLREGPEPGLAWPPSEKRRVGR